VLTAKEICGEMPIETKWEYHSVFKASFVQTNRSGYSELRRPEGPPSGATYPYRKEKETHELIFSWLSWLAVLLEGAYADDDDDDDDDGVAQDGGHTPAKRLTEKYSLEL